MADTTTSTAEADSLREKIAEYKRILADGAAVVEDFLPNIGRCVLQDYGRLNDFLLDSAHLLANEND